MVGYQHDAEQLPADPNERQSQSIDEALVVRLIMEDPLTGIAPAHDIKRWRQGTRPSRPVVQTA